MTEYENSELDIHEPVAFGQQLMLAREKAGMTIEEAARAMNLKEEIVIAIEESAMDRLPPVTFVQGYIRTYARLLGLSEEKLLMEFEEEVPHELESELHPRPPSPEGANSQTPAVKLVSIVIIVLAALVLGYAVYSYYIERTEHIEQANHRARDSGEVPAYEAQPGEEPAMVVEQETPADEVPVEPVTEAAEPAATVTEALPSAPPEQVLQAAVEPETAAPEQPPAETPGQAAGEAAVEEVMPVVPPQPITGGDVLALSAEAECWAEIVDANDIRMFYGTIRPGRDVELTGQAPFDVFLGNAPVVTLRLNSVDIDMTKYIRSNNIAQFKLSVEDGRARFH